MHSKPTSAIVQDSYLSVLEQGAVELGLILSEAQLGQLLAFLGLLQKWNKVYNLTSVRDPEAMLALHLLDSMAAVVPLQRHLAKVGVLSGREPRLLDVGSGGGLPGVIFAICIPKLTVHCVDAVSKKTAFLQQVAVTLAMKNLRGIHSRVEAIKDSYDVVSSRAFASLADFTAWSNGALVGRGVWLAMKGKQPDDEIADLPDQLEVFHVEQLTVPGLAIERCIVWMRRDQRSASPLSSDPVT